MSADLTHLWRRAQDCRPPDYVPGAVLTRLRRDLAALRCETLDETSMQCTAPDGTLTFRAQEHVESQFLMYLVTTEFVCDIATPVRFQSHLTLRHCGLLRRSGVECIAAKNGDETTRALARRLSGDDALTAALLPLDFQTCRVVAAASGCQVRLVHFGASEIVNRFPAFRRYIALLPAQQAALLAAFSALRHLLGRA